MAGQTQEEIVNYFSDSNATANSFKTKNDQDLQLQQDQAKMLAEILTILAGDNLSQSVKDTVKKYDLDVKEKKGGILGFIHGIQDGVKKIQESWKNFLEGVKKWKILIIIALVLIVGGVILYYLNQTYYFF